MVKKLLLGCAALVVLVVIGIAALIIPSWDSDGSNGAKGTESSLRQHLDDEFGGQPRVEFVCRFPVVGIAPCIPNSDRGSREVTLTFTNYELSEGTSPEEQARRIAMLAFKTSGFVKKAVKIEVNFEEQSESASVSRRYSFTGEGLAADDASSAEAAANGRAE